MSSVLSGRGGRRVAGAVVAFGIVVAGLLMPDAGSNPADADPATGKKVAAQDRPVPAKPLRASNRPNPLDARNASAAKQAAERAHAKPTWPRALRAEVQLSAGRAAPVRISGSPLRLVPANAAKDVDAKVRAEILDRKAAERAGVPGVLVRLTPMDANGSGRKVRAELDYSGFAHAYGADYGQRLTVWQLTPGPVRRLASATNDWSVSTVSADVDLPKQPGNGVVLAVAAGASGPSGDFAASSLSESSSWVAGGSAGDFSWSYGIRVPPAFNGPAPQLAVRYNSQGVDGRTAASNNQSSWAGEGFSFAEAYVERRYKSCADDGHPTKGDLCWGTDNATVMLNGKSSQVIKDDDTGDYKLSNDDGSRVEKVTGGANGDDDGEYWKLTTSDGTQYFFGRNRLTGWVSGDPETKSAWTVPVAGDDSGEPCYDSAGFAASFCDQAWRWNLDLVVDTNGHAMSLWYTPETNRYARNGSTTASAEYVRGGWLKQIDHGLRNNHDSIFGGAAEARTVFTVEERCIPTSTETCATLSGTNQAAWPDVPYDQICGSTTDCGTRVAPTFFTRKRLTQVQTQVRSSGTTYRDVEQWTFTQAFINPGDGTDAALYLDYIVRKGEAATTAASVPALDFDYSMGANRVDGLNDGLPKFNRGRVTNIDLESGGRVFIEYWPLECASGMTLTPHTNTRRCYPVRWTPDGEPELVDWFHKYVVQKVSEIDQRGQAPDKVTTYSYGGGGAWHYTQADGLVKDKYRSWSDWRGYRTVGTTVGLEDGEKSYQETLYYQGMDGDRQTPDGGTKQVTFTDSAGAVVEDADQYAGSARESEVFNGPGGARVTSTINAPWSTTTATQVRDWGTLRARIVQPGTATKRTRLSDGTDRISQVGNGYDGYGRLVTTDDRGDTSTSTDDQCSTTTYAARNTTAWITAKPARVETVSVNCASAEAASRPEHVVSDVRTYYDNLALAAAPSKGNPTKNESIARYSGGTPEYQADATTVYDTFGRPTQVTDAANNLTKTVYTNGPGGVIQTVVTGPAPFGFTETTELDPAYGLPTKTIDTNERPTRYAYDALGRVTSVWLPNQAGTNAAANHKYGYGLTNSAAWWVSSSTLQNDGSYRTSYQIYDGLLRQRQTQDPEPGGDRIITDTRYDQRGQAYRVSEPFMTSGAAASGLLTFVDADIPGLTATTFDGAGRATRADFSVRGTAKWFSATSYGGDRISVTPPAGGTATTTISDARDRTTEIRQYTASGTPSGAYIKTRYGYDGAGRLATVTDDEGNLWTTTYDLRGQVIRQVDPDKGTTTSGYDVLGHLTSTTTAKGTLAWVYDELGRKTEEHKDSPAGQLLVKWTYDPQYDKGQLHTTTRYDDNGNGFTWTVFERDSMYRPTGEWLDVPASETGLAGRYQISTNYNRDGTVLGYAFPEAGDLPMESVQFGRNLFGQELSTLGAFNDGTRIDYVTGSSYTKLGQLKTRVLGEDGRAGQTVQDFTWEEGTGRLASNAVQRYGITGYDANWNYGYDGAGNVKELRDQPTASGTVADRQCYSYDKLRRLTEAWSATGACTTAPSTSTVGGAAPYWTSYGYDDIGNRTREVKHGLAGAADTARVYEYPAAGAARPHALTKLTHTAASTTVYDLGYDGVGNQVNRDTNGTRSQTFTWDVAGRLKTATSASGSPSSFLYDADGNRLLKRDSTGTTLYIRNTELHRDNAGKVTGTRYYPHNGETVAVRKGPGTGGRVDWLVNDHHGTASVTVNSATKAVVKRWFDPFGNPRGTVPAWTTDKGFLGGTRDDTGFTHLGAREYNPSIGRFISVDPLMDLSDPATLNAYSYGANNPATVSDPTGLMNDHEPLEEGRGGAGYNRTERRIAFEYCQGRKGKQCVGAWQPDAWENFYQGWFTANNWTLEQRMRHNESRLTPQEAARLKARADLINSLVFQAIPYVGNIETARLCHQNFTADCALMIVPGGGLLRAGMRTALRHGDEAADTGKYIGKCTSGASSFAADTPVLMADGSTKPIKAIKPGDEVLAADPETGRRAAKTVTAVWVHQDKLVDLELRTDSDKDGKPDRITTTEDHPFWNATDKQWQDAQHITPGETLLTADGHLVPVGGIDWSTQHRSAAYNLTVADLHTYHVAAGAKSVLVHNTGCIPWITGGLPAAEERALNDALAHIDAGTVPTGPTSTKWGHQFKNWNGDLPGDQGQSSPYKEYRVAPPQGTSGAGPLRVVRNDQTGETYYTWTHYGDAGDPAFVRIR